MDVNPSTWPGVISLLGAIAPIILTVLTGWYAWVTFRMLAQTRAQTAAAVDQARAATATLRHILTASMPRWVHAAGEGARPQGTGIRLRNDGNSAAEAIVVSFRPPLPAGLSFTVTGEGSVRPVPPQAHLEIAIMAAPGSMPEWEGALIVQSVAIGGHPYVYQLRVRIQRDSSGTVQRHLSGPGMSTYPAIESAT